MIGIVGKGIGTDMQLVYKDFAVINFGVGIFQVGASLAQ